MNCRLPLLANGEPAMAVNDSSEGADFFKEFVEGIFPMSFPAAQTLGAELKLSSLDRPVSVLDLAAGSGVWGIALAQASRESVSASASWSIRASATLRARGPHRA